MPTRRSMARIVALSALLSVALGGCTSVTERFAGWYVTRKLDGYLDLSSQQKSAARLVVDETLSTLRRTELPRWVSFLREVRQGIHDGLDEQTLTRLQQHYDTRLDAGVVLLLPRLSPLLSELDAAQLDHFAKRMREDVDKLYEDLALPQDERNRKLEKRTLEVVEDFVGDLSAQQEQEVRMAIRALPNERPRQYRASLTNIARFRGFMAQRPGVPAIEAELESMWTHRYEALGPGRDKAARRSEQRRWLLAAYRMLTPLQRAHAEQELSDRIRMLKRFIVAT